MNQEYNVVSTVEFQEMLESGKVFKDVQLTDASIDPIIAYDLTFQRCRFSNVDFSNFELDGLNCTSSEFVNCQFTSTNLENAIFENCLFFDPERSIGCGFSRSNLRSAKISHCDISSCNFEGAKLFGIMIENSKAIGAKFFRASLNNSVKLTNNIMKYADLRGANLAKCNVTENDFTYAALDEANFTKAVLIGSNLSGATMKFAKFVGADLRGANLATFDIRALDSQGIQIFESQMRQLLENCDLIIFPDQRVAEQD